MIRPLAALALLALGGCSTSLVDTETVHRVSEVTLAEAPPNIKAPAAPTAPKVPLTAPAAQEPLTFFRGGLVVQVPEGMCVDKQSYDGRGPEVFVLMTRCAALKGAPQDDPIIITLTALQRRGRDGVPDAEELAKAAQGGKVLNSVKTDETIFVQLEKGGERISSKADPAYWRSVTVFNGHLVGLAAYEAKGHRSKTPQMLQRVLNGLSGR